MNPAPHILLVEDLATDAELAAREVRKVLPEGIFQVVDTEEAFLAALADFSPDLILSDYSMPRFDGMSALLLARERVPDTPFIVLTGSMNEETAEGCIKAGAWAYVIKEISGGWDRRSSPPWKETGAPGAPGRGRAFARARPFFRKLFEEHTANQTQPRPRHGGHHGCQLGGGQFYGCPGELRKMRIQNINTLPPEA
jgi:CheY-like chemotaxis protein